MLLLEDFYIIQSAEILQYHNVGTTQKCFKYDDSNKKTLYVMFVNILCNMQACDNIFRKRSELNEWRKLSQSVLIIQYLYVACSPQPAIQWEEEGLPFVPDDKAFISTYCFLPAAGQFAVVRRCS